MWIVFLVPEVRHNKVPRPPGSGLFGNCIRIQGNVRGKGQATNLWRYRALRQGLYVFKHEYVMLFRRPG